MYINNLLQVLICGLMIKINIYVLGKNMRKHQGGIFKVTTVSDDLNTDRLSKKTWSNGQDKP